MFMVEYSPKVLNFGYGFVLLVHFLGHPVEYDHEAHYLQAM